MKAIDTNILARYIVQDNPRQTAIAEAVLAEPGFISITVMLEAAWLFSSRYRMGRSEVAANLGDVMALPEISVDDRDLIDWALVRFIDGADIADMLHLIAGRSADAFVTFDTLVTKAAGADSPVPIETLDRH